MFAVGKAERAIHQQISEIAKIRVAELLICDRPVTPVRIIADLVKNLMEQV